MNELDVQLKKKLKNFSLDMNFSVGRECLGILGASGCGKSMTLKSIAGIVTPDTGKIRTENKVFFDSENKINIPAQKRRVGYLFQNYALFPNMTVEQNILTGVLGGSREKKISKSEMRKKVKELMERFHILDLEKQYPFKLSGGQQQRVALARIIGSDPEILLLDEPFSAMDSYLREELQIELRNQLKEFDGCSIIVSHDRDEIYKLCDKTMVIDKGKNVEYRDTKTVFSDPVHVAAARLTGCKNISKAVKMSENKVRATEWNVDFRVDRKVSEDVKYIGIRAHDFVPVSKGYEEEHGMENLINIRVCDVTETPFEKTVLFKNAADPNGNMWMKLKKECDHIPESVYVDKNNILLLTD